MLESLYYTLFAPGSPREALPSLATGWLTWLLVAAVLALPLAGTLALGGSGTLALLLFLWATLVLAWFWAGTALTAIARHLGGQGDAEATMGAIAEASWPWILLGPLAVLGELTGPAVALHSVAHLAVALWVILLLVDRVARVQRLDRARALGALSLLVALFVLGGLLLVGIPTLVAAYWVA